MAMMRADADIPKTADTAYADRYWQNTATHFSTGSHIPKKMANTSTTGMYISHWFIHFHLQTSYSPGFHILCNLEVYFALTYLSISQFKRDNSRKNRLEMSR